MDERIKRILDNNTKTIEGLVEVTEAMQKRIVVLEKRVDELEKAGSDGTD